MSRWFTALTTVAAGLGLVVAPAATSAAEASGTNLGACVGAGTVLRADQYLAAPTVRVGIDSFSPYQLWMQGDGNFVAYASGGRPIWASQTAGNPGAYAVLQAGDGNLVVYSASGRPLWAAYPPTSPGDRLCMQGDGNVVVYSSSGAALWATMTGAPWGRGQTTSGNYYPWGQCTWWAEQQAAQYTGLFLANLGNAKDWAANAQARGWPVGSWPQIGSIAVFQPSIPGTSSYGHVAWVTEVYPSQNAIVVTEMNYAGFGVVDSRRISPAFYRGGLQYIYLNP